MLGEWCCIALSFQVFPHLFTNSFVQMLRTQKSLTEYFPIECFCNILMTALIWQCLEGFENNCDLKGFRQSCKESDFAGDFPLEKEGWLDAWMWICPFPQQAWAGAVRCSYCSQCCGEVQLRVRYLHAGTLKEPLTFIKVEFFSANPMLLYLSVWRNLKA